MVFKESFITAKLEAELNFFVGCSTLENPPTKNLTWKILRVKFNDDVLLVYHTKFLEFNSQSTATYNFSKTLEWHTLKLSHPINSIDRGLKKCG